jgi:diguanylate cyclase (GGDEF)-like protein
MSLNRLLRLLAILLLLATAVMVGRIALVEWRVQGRAEAGEAAVGNLRVALVAAEMVSRERGPTNGLMGAELADQPKRRESLAEARARTDVAFGNLRRVLDGRTVDPRLEQASERFREAEKALVVARAAVDSLAALPRAQREPAQIRARVAGMVAVVPLIAPAASLFAEEAQQALPALGDEIQGARMTAELREYAGLLGSHFTAALTAQQPFSIDERAAIERTRGRIDQLRVLLDLRLRTPGTDTGAHDAWLRVTELYFGRAGALIDRVVAAGTTDGRYGLDPAGFAAAYVPDMNSLFDLRDLLLKNAAARADSQSREARRVLMLTAGGSVTLLAVLVGSILLLQRRVLRPLVQTAGALDALARDDLQVALPALRANDEMAAVVGAVRNLHHSIRQRQELEQERDLLIERLRTLSNTDFLTGLPNRRSFMQEAERGLAHARRMGIDTALIVLDVDSFKLFNDTHGHAAGDCALVAVAEAVKQQLRAGDLAARLGGEEFVVLLNHCRATEAMTLAERLRAAIAAAPVMLPGQSGTVQVTASLGLAAATNGTGELADLLQRADRAMYQAKNGGRNRVVLHRPDAGADAHENAFI